MTEEAETTASTQITHSTWPSGLTIEAEPARASHDARGEPTLRRHVDPAAGGQPGGFAIVRTNFDRLIEIALLSAGIEAQMLSGPGDLPGMIPVQQRTRRAPRCAPSIPRVPDTGSRSPR